MDKAERQQADMLRYRIKKIMPDLKLAYDDAKILANKYGWDIDYWKMSEDYMNLANEYIDVVETLEEEDGGGEE